MLTATTAQVRTEKASFLLKAIKWIMSRRKPVFPHTAYEFQTYMANRKLPRDAAMPPKMTKKYDVTWWEAAGQKVVTLHPKSGPGEWHMLYFHGGGFVLPMFKEHWPLVDAMIDQCGVSITVPLYDVVPETSHEAQDALAYEVYDKLAEQHDSSKIILNGDSAGGHMALALALRLVRTGDIMPGKLALFAPWLDLTLKDPAIAEVEPNDFMLKIGTLRECGKLFAEGREPASAECSPLYASPEDLSKLPPTRIWTGQHDLFIVDSRTFSARLNQLGVDAMLYEYAEAPHVFMAVTPTREAKDTFALLSEFLAE